MSKERYNQIVDEVYKNYLNETMFSSDPTEFINESLSQNAIPTYEQAVELCSGEEAPFYESKMVVDGFNVSVFNYRLAQYKDFANPIPEKPE
jgi:hypothetical protein